MTSRVESKKAKPEKELAMKIERSCRIKANATDTRGGLRRIFCSLFLVTAFLATVEAFASLRANQGSMGLSNVLQGNIIVVTNTNDSGPGSLRAALADANDGDTINFDASLKGQTITLTSGQLNVDKDVTISGPGANNLAVDGNAQSRVFYVNPGKTVTIDSLTVANGYSDSGGGGGIFNSSATMTVANCSVSGNSAAAGSYGGGICNGGFNGNATMTVTNCTVSSNSAYYGGGIANTGEHGGAVLTVSNSIISGNSGGMGGGISNGGGFGGFCTATVSNSTISGNSADYAGAISNGAGGNSFAALRIINSTLSGNSADSGGGIYILGEAGLATGNTIFDAGASGENIFNKGGTVTSLGYNVSSDNGGGYLTSPGDQINTDPMLGPLQENGGPTFTHELLAGSPAINSGDPSFTPPPLYDQRGPSFDRVVNGRVDVGSFEVQSPTPTPTPTPTATPTATATPTSTPRPSPTPRPRQTPHPRPSP